jgi:hypothetical protein
MPLTKVSGEVINATFSSSFSNAVTVSNSFTVTTANTTLANLTSSFATFSGNLVINTSNATITVGVSNISNTNITVGNSSVNTTITNSSITFANSSVSSVFGLGSISSTNTVLSGITTFSNAVFESASANSSGITGAQTIDVLTQTVVYYSSNSVGNFTVNVRGNSTTTLNSILGVNQGVTVTLIVTQGASAGYYPTSFAIDGTTVTPKWISGVAPSLGDFNAINIYSYNIFKTASATYNVFASYNKYA